MVVGKPIDRKENYQYTWLAELDSKLETYEAINIYGLVTEWSPPCRTKGTDFCCRLELTDPSLINLSHAQEIKTIQTMVFAPDPSMLPRVKKAGDIIRFNRVNVQMFGGRLQLKACIGGRGYNRPRSSFCIFDGFPSSNATEEELNQAYQTSGQTYQSDPKHQNIMAVFRQYAQEGTWRGGATNTKYRKKISELFSDEETRACTPIFADVVAFVVGVQEGPEPPPDLDVDGQISAFKDNNPSVLWVWDATDAQVFPPNYTTDICGPAAPRPLDEATAKRVTAYTRRRSFPISSLPLEVVTSIPLYGTILPILVREHILARPESGTWVKFRNCRFHVAQGQVQGVMELKSKWSPFTEDQSIIDEYDRRLNNTQVSTHAPPLEQSITDVTSPHGTAQPIHSLRSITAYASSPDAQPSCYRCYVRIINYWPTQENIANACVPAAAVADAAQQQGYTDLDTTWLFALRLEIEDGSGSVLGVDVFGKDGEEFFKNIVPPQDLNTSEAGQHRLLTALENLVGNNNDNNIASPYWADICIKSYYPTTSNGLRSGNVPRYRIFNSCLKASLVR